MKKVVLDRERKRDKVEWKEQVRIDDQSYRW